MTFSSSRTNYPTQRRRLLLYATLFIGSVLIASLDCFAQAENLPPVTSRPTVDKPLTSDERVELLKLIRSLQERLDKLEAAQASKEPAPVVVPTPVISNPSPTPSLQPVPEPTPQPIVTAKSSDDDENDWAYGRYTPNYGFK